MRILCRTIFVAGVAVAVSASAETIFEARGLVTDKTPGKYGDRPHATW